MISSIVYVLSTGEITKKCVTPDEDSAKAQATDREAVIFADSEIEGKYVDISKNPHEISSQQPNPAKLTSNVIKSIPAPSVVTVYWQDEESIQVDDGEFELDSDIPGSYLAEVRPLDAKYEKKIFEVQI